MKKRFFKILLICLLPALLVGCAKTADPTQQDELMNDLTNFYGPTAKAPSALTSFSLPYLDAGTLDPITCADGIQQNIGSLLYEGLFELDQAFEPQPLLCESYSYQPDTFTYTFTLKSAAVFSDGSSVTAKDVAAALRRAATSERYRARLSTMASVTATDDHTLVLRLSAGNASFVSRLDIPIVKSGTESQTAPVGSGPYVFAAADSGAYLSANTAWWQGQHLPISRIELHACKNNDAVAYAFHTHDIQMLTCDLTGTDSINLSGNGNYTDADTPVMQYVGINTASTLFADPALRSALNLGIDRKGIVSAYLLGHGTAAQFPLSPASALYPSDLEISYSAGNFESAMAAAGYCAGTSRRATLIVNKENSFKVSIAQKVAENLSAYDLKVTVQTLAWEEYQRALQSGSYDLYLGEIKLSADWDLSPLLSTGGALNYSRYNDENMNLLMLNSLSAGSDTQRVDSMKALCQYLQQQSPILPLCFKTNSVLLQSGAVTNDITPTAANPFYHFSHWTLNLKK